MPGPITGGLFDFLSQLSSAEVAITGAGTLTASAFGKMHVCSGTSADYTVGLPAVSGNAGKFIGFRMTGGLTRFVTLDGNSAELIDDELLRIMWKLESAILHCDGTSWTKIAGKSIPMICKMTPSSDQGGVVTGTPTKVTLGTVLLDNTGLRMGDSTNSRIYTRRPGYYRLTPLVRFSSLAGNVSRLISYIFVNGVETYDALSEISGLSGAYPIVGNPVINDGLVAGDYFELECQHNYGSNMTLNGGGTLLNCEEIISW